MISKSVAAMILPATFLSVSHASAKDVALAPSSKWNVHYGASSCIAARSFGEGESAVTLRLEQIAPGHYYDVSFFGKPVEASERLLNSRNDPSRTRRLAEMRIGDGNPFDRAFYSGETKDGIPSLSFGTMTYIASLQTAGPIVDGKVGRYGTYAPAHYLSGTLDTISLRIGSSDRQILMTGPLDPVLAKLTRCGEAFVTSWGFDVEKMRSLKTGPVIENVSAFTDAIEYPPELLRQGGRGIVTLRLSVEADGSPSDCHAYDITEPAGFSESLCAKAFETLTFKPATDTDGNAVRAYYIQRINFTIPS